MSENLNVSDVVLKRFLRKNQTMQLKANNTFIKKTLIYNSHGFQVSHKGNSTLRAIFVRKGYGRVQRLI